MTGPDPDPDAGRAVIFDVDGVLVDSHAAHMKSWLRLAAATDAPPVEQQFAAMFGRPGRDVISALWRDQASTAERVEDLYRRKRFFYREAADDISVTEGAPELVDALHEEGFRLAIASAGSREGMDIALRKLGRAPLFGVRVTIEDVNRGKPNPEVYTMATARLGLSPRCCAAIEDSPAGIEAAQLAGVRVIGLALDGHARGALARADRVVRSLRQLSPRSIGALISSGSSRLSSSPLG